MRIIVIRYDSVIGIDGVSRIVDLSATLPEGVASMQWDHTAGYIAYEGLPNTRVYDIAVFQPYIDLWEAAAPPPPPEPTPDELIADAQARINAAYEASVSEMTAGYPPSEIASWPKQEYESRAWLLDANAPTPWLDAATVERGIAKEDLVSKIIEQADLFAPIHGYLTGKRQRLRDEIEALGPTPTKEQLDAIVW